jgi:NADPH-dependent curcumin reductase CurA
MALSEGEFILKTLELSVDPFMRHRMREHSPIPHFPLNQPITSDTMSVVIRSNNSDYKLGDLVSARSSLGKFEEYVHVTAEYAKQAYIVRNNAKETGLPISYYCGALAIPGLTAYYANVMGKPKAGETVYISAAAGATGQLAGQLAKAAGAYVVGSAGSDDKVEFLKSIGFDDAFNYKKGDLVENLKRTCPNGIDVDFEAVGGENLDAVLAVANVYARIVVYGMISQYNLSKSDPIYNISAVIGKCLTMSAFIAMEHLDVEEQFISEVSELLAQGKVKFQETISVGFDKAPQALIDVFKGNNLGKQIVHVADL